MKIIEEIRQVPKLMIEQIGEDGGCGFIYLGGTKGRPARVVFSWGGGWEHVSVSFSTRCPTWEEMCKVKDMFWNEDECVIQYHPPKSEYVNNHPYCLHLWRKCGENFELPPKYYV
ncbi:MAG: hypothetical protein K1W18_07020 [Oscillospiraceae bacterium]